MIRERGHSRGMITVDTIGKVRRAFFVQGRKIKAIAREQRLSRNTVRDIVRAGAAPEATVRRYVRKDQPLPVLGRISGRWRGYWQPTSRWPGASA